MNFEIHPNYGDPKYYLTSCGTCDQDWDLSLYHDCPNCEKLGEKEWKDCPACEWQHQAGGVFCDDCEPHYTLCKYCGDVLDTREVTICPSCRLD